MDKRYDVLVLGGGPAGATTAALVAEFGPSTLLVEREEMPRPHVGESLMPETWWTLERLGVIERMKKSRFVRKVGVQFAGPSGRQSQPFFFSQHDPRECAQTWHVERAEFDHMLFQNAAEKGADCQDCMRVTKISLGDDGLHTAVLRDRDHRETSVEARVIVDATGQQAVLANQLGLRQPIPHLRKAAIWGHFRGAARDSSNAENPDDCQVTWILHSREKRSWFWYIPLSENRVSVGLVGDHEYLLKDRGEPSEVFAEEVKECVGLSERLVDAALIDRLQVAKEFSYTTSKHAGDGWVLVGDAFGFLDPIYSTGVLLALKSGELAADAISDGLRRDDTSAEQLGRWTGEFKRSIQLFRKMVDAYYTNEFSYAEFIRRFPHHQGNLTDLLIGRAFQPGADELFKDLDPMIGELKPPMAAVG